VAIGFFCILIVGAVLVSIGSICSYCYHENSRSDLFAALWLLYLVIFCPLSFFIMFVSLVNHSSTFAFIGPIFFLSFLLISELLLFKAIVGWWKSFFGTTDQFSIPSNSASHNVPVAARQTLPQLAQILKLPPQSLMRLSGTYFKPVASPKQAVFIRTISDEVQKSQVISPPHNRSLSNAKHILTRHFKSMPSDFSFADKKCEICFENECDAVLMECGHGGICMHCAEVLLNSKGRCYMCRGDITQVLKIRVEASKELKVVGVSNS
jgi:hypothetical protein